MPGEFDDNLLYNSKLPTNEVPIEGGIYVQTKTKNPNNKLSLVFFVEYNEEDQYKTLLFITNFF